MKGLQYVTALCYACTAVVAYPAYLCLTSGNLGAIVFGVFMLMAANTINAGAVPTYIVYLFPAHLRTTAVGLVYNLAHAVFTSTCTVICTVLADDVSYTSPALYLVFICMLSFFSSTIGMYWAYHHRVLQNIPISYGHSDIINRKTGINDVELGHTVHNTIHSPFGKQLG